MKPFLHIKAELASRGRKIKELAEALQWEYGKVSRVLNGFQPASEGFDQQVRKVFLDWDADNEPQQYEATKQSQSEEKD
jgi:hypothetical protein